jgi:hypothetical protein
MKHIVCLTLILFLTGIATAAEQTLIITSDASGEEAANGLARFLKNKDLLLEQAPLATLDKTAPVLAIFGSSKADGPAAALMAEALKDGLAATQSDTYRDLLVRRDVWAKGQLVLLFIGHNPAAIKNAVSNGKEVWSAVLGGKFNLQLSDESLYGY